MKEAGLAVRLFKEIRGDKPLGAITKEDARIFRKALEQRPTRLPAAVHALPLPELLKSPAVTELPPPSATTVNKLLDMLSAIVSRAEKDGLTDDVSGFANAFKGVRTAIDKRHKAARKPFDAADLKAIFETPVYAAGERPESGSGEAAHWLPLLALLTGARLEELAQLRVCDVRKDAEAAVWFLDVDTSGGRTVKSEHSRRTVPLHPELVRIGFLGYREEHAKAGPKATLWPEVESASNLSAAWSKWFGRYLREAAGVTDPAKVFHSFRHTFKRLARDAGLTEEMHDALTGHAGGGGVGRDYGRGFGLKALAEGVAKIEAPAAVLGLKRGPEPGHGGKSRDAGAEGTPVSDD